MKANIENLKRVLEICAEAHNATLSDWSDDGQFGIDKECVPVHADVQRIAESFFNDCDVESEYGYVTLYMTDSWKDEVDLGNLQWALPYGSLDKLK